MKRTLVATGHRPPRLGLDYGSASNRRLTLFAERHLSLLSDTAPIGAVVVGMAQGWDTACGHAAVRLGLPLICALPFPGMELRWPAAAQARFNAILGRAARVHVCRPSFSRGAYLERDEWMVDLAVASPPSALFALWDGGGAGGTAHTVRYARSAGLAVENLWEEWRNYA